MEEEAGEEVTEPVFDPDLPYAKRREFGGSVTLCQYGHEFDLRHEYVGVDANYQPPKIDTPEDAPAPNLADEGREGVLRRAAAKLDGYSEPEDIGDSAKENARALAAERLAG